MTTRFQVDHIHCGSCARRIEEAIRKVQADALVKVYVDGDIIEVDNVGDRAAIHNAIQDAGYSPISMT